MEQKHLAGFWVRFFATLLDALFLLPFLAILIYSFSANEYEFFSIKDSFYRYNYFSSSSQNNYLEFIAYGLTFVYVFYFLTNKNQATWGKRILGIYVGNLDGSRISKQKAIARGLISLLTTAAFCVGFLLVIFTKEKTAPHDIICKTRVFHGKKS